MIEFAPFPFYNEYRSCLDTNNDRGIHMNQPMISQRKLLGIAGLGWLFDAMDVGMLSFLMAAYKIT